jgi:methionyl-tRNA formyltransferase
VVDAAGVEGKTRQLRLVFCGTPPFAVPTLRALLGAGHEIALVLTQPDRPVGRKQELTPPAVKLVAQAASLPVAQPDKIRNNLELRAQLESIAPEAIVVVAYGRILPPWMLTLPRLGCINLHGSLLPKYRGAAPAQWAVAMGETETGNTTMLLDEGLDTGAILMQQRTPIGPDETAVDVLARLSNLGAPLVVETLASLAAGTMTPRAQDGAQATPARILERDDGRMDFAQRTAMELYNRWRGFQPWPGAFTVWNEKKLIVHGMRPGSLDVAGEPGQIAIQDGRYWVACAGNTWLEFLELQLEGKKRVAASEFLHGHAITPGARLG